MPKKKFKKKALASSITLAITSSLYLQSSTAQEVEEEVIVTGIRGSLIRSLDVKRNATGIVDAISAEDIGKFPDTNLAESLQRITGVSINRNNGEGQQITVRGFGPDSNIVTLNGRHMPAARVNTGGPSNTRAFNFSDLAAEGVSGVQVYKTGRASIASGGATIDISTLKPLDRPGFNFTAGVKAVHDTTNREGDDVTPEISTLISHSTDDERFGVSFVGSYQERDSSTNGIDHNDWRTQAFNPNDALFRNGTVVNAPEVGQLWSQPRNLVYQLDDIERKRTNGQLTFQFRPVENFTASLDYTYSEQESTTERLEQSIWFEPAKGAASGVTRIEFDDNTVATPILYSERFNAADGFSDLTFAKILLSTLNENESIGLNLDWNVNENLNLRLDYHDSTAEAGPVNSTLGTRSRFSVAAFGVAEQEVNFGQSRPGSRIVIDDPTPPGGVGAAPDPRGIINGSFGVEDLSSTRGEAVFTDTVTDIQQLQIGGSFEFEDGSIDFGIDRREMVNRTRSANIQPVFGDWGGAAPEIVPDDFFTPINVPGEIGVDGFSNGFDYDFQTLADWAAGVNAGGTQGNNFRDFNNGIFSTDREFETDRQIEEDITALFVQNQLLPAERVV